MPNIISDGFYIFHEYWEIVLVFLVTIFGIGFYSTGIVLKRASNLKLRILASLGVGGILLGLISFVLIVASHFWEGTLQFGSYGIFIFAVFVLIKEIWTGNFKEVFTFRTFVLMTGLFFLLLARLAFLKHTLLPPYSDSPIHYQIVSGFLYPDIGGFSNLSTQTTLNNYYHFGFHSLAAWLSSVSDIDPAVSISLLGQLFLVIAPVSMFFLVYALTNDLDGALFAGFLAALGWTMPAFAVNWGKFPALASIAIAPFIMALPVWLKDGLKKTGVLVYALILLAGITFIHTRIIICMFFAYIGFIVVDRLQIREEFDFFRSIRFTLLFLLFLWPFFHTLVDFYNSAPVFIVLLILIPFAFQAYSAVSTGVLIFLSGLSLSALIPNLLGIGGETLLDRQFLAMILYIPLAFMGGLGFGGLVGKLGRNTIPHRAVVIILMGAFFISFTPRSFYPDQCCNYFNKDDGLAFNWIRDNSSSHSLYFISTFSDGERAYGTDAGVWILSLTRTPTNKLPFDINWTSPNLFNEICPSEMGEAYIYMGGGKSSFDNEALSRLKWVAPVFRAGEVIIYKISSCTTNMGKE